MVNSYSVTEERSEVILRLKQVDCLYSNGDSKPIRNANSSVGTVTSDNPDPLLIVSKVL
jgi:hypothetical protein